jgi:ABC-type bacteriocin/lantibiotic exporter with double-glycine peptidase domain
MHTGGFGSRWRRVLVAAVLAVAAGCAGGSSREIARPGPVPYLAQERRQSCLIAATAMVLRAYGVPATEDRLWSQVRSWGEGTTVFEVQDLLEARGFDGLAFRSAPPELAAILAAGYPVIAVVGWPQKHAIVVVGRDLVRGTLRLHDPKAGGPADVDAAAFDARWTATGREAFLIVRHGDRRLAERGLAFDRIVDESRQVRATELALREWLRAGPADEAAVGDDAPSSR